MRNKRRRVKRKNTPKRKSATRNGLERNIEEQLLELVGPRKVTYETDVIEYEIPKKYNPDFTIKKKNGGKMFIEVKGYFRPEDRTKMKHVRRCNPRMDIRMVFARDNLIPHSKMKYSDWCKKYGYKYAIGHIPKSWLRGI